MAREMLVWNDARDAALVGAVRRATNDNEGVPPTSSQVAKALRNYGEFEKVEGLITPAKVLSRVGFLADQGVLAAGGEAPIALSRNRYIPNVAELNEI